MKRKPYMLMAFTPTGEFIGEESMAKALYEKGIEPELANPHDRVCTIGYCKRKRKWYGWSHRALAGFGIGYKVKKGDACISPELGIKVGFKAKNLDDCKKLAKAFAENAS